MFILGHGTVVTMTEDAMIIRDGGVVVDGEEIIKVGKTNKLKEEYAKADFRDVSGKLIMPGLINTYMHLYSTFARGMDLKTDNSPKNFTEILKKLWWRLDAKLNKDDIYYSALYAIIDSIKRGTTTIFDHHASFGFIDGSLDIIAKAVKEAGIRANLSYEVSDRHGFQKAMAALNENKRFINSLKGKENNYLGGTIGLHASFTLEDKTLEQAANLADELKVPFHLHTAEGWADVKNSRQRGYKGVIDRLDRYNIWRPQTLAIHGVYLSRDELEKLADKKCYLIHNPQSNMGNAVGVAPVKSAFDSSLTVGLGTDGYTTDMFTSTKVANLLQSHKQGDPRAGTNEARKMALVNNNLIANNFFAPDLGQLKQGAAADIIVVDYTPPTPITKDNSFFHLLMGLQGSMVDTTIIGGKVLMENREVKCVDYEQICRKSQEQAKDFWRRF
ncbi:putative selenium metabolism protein SsnA [Halobacteroides halobius DSM 5150]|uniref:Putative selenium metabolism protein SsnA n=1 Tax=Halobacteroides halobius (strain ATCC 35273 / DSM 5150 / MD-1) TaxID=748449 RepID=L0KA77_HALHC|nr:putative aminohydrolase SsnA [Halobacteroides halobius]AGB41008.1 putative selenium metabolism protein SsnA [Halobacteroides halobius DSM 5150]